MTTRYSGSGRVGQTGAQGTAWLSETSLVCGVGGGLEGSLRLAVTMGTLAGSETEGASYDASGVSIVAPVNVGKTGGGSMTVAGAGFGTRRCAIVDFLSVRQYCFSTFVIKEREFVFGSCCGAVSGAWREVVVILCAECLDMESAPRESLDCLGVCMVPCICRMVVLGRRAVLSGRG